MKIKLLALYIQAQKEACKQSRTPFDEAECKEMLSELSMEKLELLLLNTLIKGILKEQESQ